MKKKIQDIILGKFEYETPRLLLPESDLAFSVVENEVYEGSFSIVSSGGPIRGIVTCQNPNISCITTTFDAQKADIHFTYHAESLTEGDMDRGQFVITSSSGEYLFPFCASVTRRYLRSSIGRIKTLNDFSNLAKLNWEEALGVFQSPHFFNVFHEQHEFCSLLYEGVTARSNGSHEMEEFLIGCGKKHRNQLALEKKDAVYPVGKEIISDTFVLTKSEWGYTWAKISVDAPFVRLEKRTVQMYDFVGKHAQIPFQIVPRLMHGGKNYALIKIENCFQKLELLVTAFAKGEAGEKSSAALLKKIRYEMAVRFLDYQMGRMDADAWAKETLELIGQAKMTERENRWNALFAAYVYLKIGEKEKAEKEADSLPRSVRGQRSPLGAFYLYLTTFEEDDALYVREVTVKVREIFLKHQNHPILVWILLQIDEALRRNPERKYNMIKKFVSDYSKSPVFYAEAAALVRENPALLYRQDAFENRLIFWMAKKNQLTEPVALRILGMAQAKKQFEPAFFRVLGRCYKILQSSEAVKTICVYLIRLNQYGEKYFPWFQRGITQHLKIAGLYEAYMLSWSKAEGALPKEVIKYFSMNSSLPAKRKALLFSYVVRNRERLGKDWDAYMVMVKNFAVKELEKGHMSEELAVIYEEVKKTTDRELWDKQKREAESCYRVRTMGEDIAAIRVLQKDCRVCQRVQVYPEGGYIYLYRRPFVILYEDALGQIYSAKDSFRIKKMISGEHIYAPEPKQAIPAAMSDMPENRQSLAEQLKQFFGSVEEMEALILQAQKRGIDVSDAKAQLLIRELFTGKFTERSGQFFVDIGRDEDTVMVQDAYASWFAYRYLTEDEAISEEVAEYIGRTLKERKMNGYCEAAYLKAFCEKNPETHASEAGTILQKYLFAGKYFDFYGKLPVKMKKKYLLAGIYVIQYRHRPGEKLFLRAGKRREAFQEVLHGIYTTHVLLFTGDRLAYEIVDEEGNWLGGDVLVCGECEAELADTRYGRICAMPENRPDSKAQFAFAERNDLTKELFLPIEE